MGFFKKRTNQTPITVELKLIPKKKWQREYLFRLFREVTWLRNWTIDRLNSGWKFNWSRANKIKKVRIKTIFGFEIRRLEVLASQMKQAVQCEILQNLTALSELKKRGHKIGKLKFQREHRMLALTPQMFKFPKANRVRFAKLPRRKSIYVRGYDQLEYWKQLDPNAEIGDSKLLKRADGYYLHVTLWIDEEVLQRQHKQQFEAIGLDFGIRHAVTCSNGIQIDITGLEKSKRIRRLHKMVSRRKRGSSNRQKARQLLRKAYRKWVNKKRDVRNRIWSYFRKFKHVAFQDELIRFWKLLFGKQIEQTTIGSIIGCLKQRHSGSMVVDKSVPTTKTCSNCGCIQYVDWGQTVFRCSDCGFSIDRDINAARNMLILVGLERTEVTPVEYETSARLFGPSPYMRVSLVQ